MGAGRPRAVQAPPQARLRRSARPRKPSARGAALLAGAALAATLAGAAPDLGRYEATLCVSVPGQPRHCGPAEVVIGSGSLQVQVSDIVYRVLLRGGETLVVVSHGAVQVDAFAATAEWTGAALRLADEDKQVRYEVQVGAPKR